MSDTIFCPGAVVLDIKSQDKADAIKEVVFRAQVFDCIFNKAQLIEAIFTREEEGPCLGHGVAFAHGKTPEVPEMKVALGISRQGIYYASPHTSLVHLLFVVATHPSMHLDYLRKFSILAKMARRESFRREILSCFAPEEAASELQRAFSLCRGIAG